MRQLHTRYRARAATLSTTQRRWQAHALLLCTLCAAVVANQAMANTTSGTARVIIQETLGLAEQETVDFGVIPNANGTCSMGSDGALSGSGGAACSGSGQLGEFVVTGTEDQAVSISVATADEVNGLTFNPSLQSESNQTLVDGSATVRIGGNLEINNPDEGLNELNYIITVNYN